MHSTWIRRAILVAMGVSLALLARSSDVSKFGAVALLALAAFDILSGLRGRKLTPKQREFELVDRQADRLSKTDPVAADRMLDEYFQRAGEHRAHEREALRGRATVDLEAAKRLAKLLQQEMEGHLIMRDRFLARISPEERAAAEAVIDKRDQETRRELEQLESTILRLKG